MLRAALCASLSLGITAAAFAGDPPPGVGATLFDRGATAGISLSGSAGGMNFLSTDGQTSKLRLQGFWFRTAGMDREFNICTLALTGFFASDTNSFTDNRPDTLAAQFSGPGFNIQPTWTLRGGNAGSGRADILELIAINNTGQTPLVISFFQFSNFVLSTQAGPFDHVEIVGGAHNTAQQSGNAGFLSETVVTPAPSRYSAGDANALLALLENNSVDNLDNNAAFGPGNAAWAYQWDFVIPVGGTVLISKDKSLIPTPGATALLAAGGLVAMRRRRQSV